VPPERDLAAFDARATTYEGGWLGRLHHDIADRAADLAAWTSPAPRRVLDVGCGTGYLLRDQLSGLRECARVLRPGGSLVLVDQFSRWLAPTLLVSRRGKARTKRRCGRLLEAAGFRSLAWHDGFAVIIRAVTAKI
jgi:ubiquinone/menaquinone biosynthesis C-methylase UbiE